MRHRPTTSPSVSIRNGQPFGLGPVRVEVAIRLGAAVELDQVVSEELRQELAVVGLGGAQACHAQYLSISTSRWSLMPKWCAISWKTVRRTMKRSRPGSPPEIRSSGTR